MAESTRQASFELATESQIDVLLAIERSAGTRFDELRKLPEFRSLQVPTDITPLAEFQDAIKAGLCWIAFAGDDPCGFVYGSIVGNALFVEELDVLVEYGRRGIGAGLLRAAEQKAKQLGLARTALTTYRDVPWNAPWYGRMGYVELADFRPEDDELMLVAKAEGARGFSQAQRVLLAKNAS